MHLILIKSPGDKDEQVFYLQPGNNSLGSDPNHPISLQGSHVRPHHLNIEYTYNALHVSGTSADCLFLYQAKLCHKAVIQPGESFSVDGIQFYCSLVSSDEKTDHAMLRTSKTSGRATSTTSSQKLGDLQISGFLTQKQITGTPLIIGRNAHCDLVLNHPQVSAFHAKIQRTKDGVAIQDLRSSNGTYVNDNPVREAILNPGDTCHILPFFLIFTGDYINVYALQQQSTLIGWQVDVVASSKKILDRVTLACQSNELVGLIGPSGSGKTTLMKCLSGQTLPAAGRIQLNGLEIFSHFDLFKRNIGFVPQDDIIHRELTVHQTLMYAAKLRLPADMSEKERKIRVWETLIELELEEQQRLAVHRLSGGQRKRVNIAIELLTKPGILFLDEPTSGLDPALDEKLMILFKKLSQDGRITILTTHLLEHAMIFSKIALMHTGRLIFFGSPTQAIEFFDVPTLSALYSKIKERPAEEWLDQFQKTDFHQNIVSGLRDQILPSKRPAPAEVNVEPPSRSLTQWKTLSQRYLDIILRDKKNTGILLLQAPLIAFFIVVATANLSSRLFMMILAALWFGCNNSAREICKELPLYRRERMVNLRLLPYLASKFVVLSGLVFLQCLVLALLTPSSFLTAYGPILLCGLAGIALGLFVSSIVDSPDKAIALVPIILIPQVLFSGIFGELKGFQGVIGETMISKWSYNLLKKQFHLPSFDYKDRLEKQIDDNQEVMKKTQDEIVSLQQELDVVLDEMEEAYDPAKLNDLRYDANKLTRKLKEKQNELEDARATIERVEQKLRSNAKLFGWIDRPDNPYIDWIVLVIFTLIFFTASVVQLKRRDRLLKQT